MDKKPIELTRKEVEICVDIHKKMMMAIAEAFSKDKLGKEKEFHISTMAISFTISNLMKTLGVTKVDRYLKDLNQLTKETFPHVIKNSNGYVIYNKGEKVGEGSFN